MPNSNETKPVSQEPYRNDKDVVDVEEQVHVHFDSVQIRFNLIWTKKRHNSIQSAKKRRKNGTERIFI